MKYWRFNYGKWFIGIFTYKYIPTFELNYWEAVRMYILKIGLSPKEKELK